MATERTRSLLSAALVAALFAAAGYMPLALVVALTALTWGALSPGSPPPASLDPGAGADHAWIEAFEVLRLTVDESAPFDEVEQAATKARDAAPQTGPEVLLVDIEVARCRASDGDLSEDLRRELTGYLALTKHLWGPEDGSYGDVAFALGLVHWGRAEACLESGGEVAFHDRERLERVGQNVLQFFRPEDAAEEEDPLDDGTQPSTGARLAAYAFHWQDLYQAEELFGEAAAAYDAAFGPGGVRAAQCRSRLAQALAVNRAPGRGIELAGQALRDLGEASEADPHVLGPVYTALGLGYQLQGREAEAKIYFDRSDALTGGESTPELGAPPELPEISSTAEREDGVHLRLDGDASEVWVHLSEEAEPTIH